MRIAMLSVHSSPLASLGSKEAGGMNVYVKELSSELGRRGIPVDIFTRLQDSKLPSIQNLAPGVRVVNLRAGPAVPYNKNLILRHLPEFTRNVTAFATSQQLHYSLIHSHYWLSGEAALSLRQAWDLPIVNMFHTLGTMKNSVARSVEEAETKQRVAIERRLMQEVEVVVAATPLDRAQMVWHYGADASRIQIIPCGVDHELFAPQAQPIARQQLGLNADDRLIVCVGRMEPLKGMDILIQALALLTQRMPALHGKLKVLLIGGENETNSHNWNTEQHRLDDMRQQLGLQKQVIFLGTQPQERLSTYYAAADLVAAPSFYESFGLAALEAMACGKPVIASNVGGLGWTIEAGRNGLLVPPGDSAALAAQIEWLLNDAQAQAALGQAARQRALNFSWRSVTCKVLKLYHSLLKERLCPCFENWRLAQVC